MYYRRTMGHAIRRILPLVVFLAAAAWIAASGWLRGGFRIDEVHKLAETVFLRHAMAGEFSHPDWFSDPVERANPPVGKFLFGLAVRVAGLDLPRDLSVAEETNHGQTQPPPGEAVHYRQMLRPVRTLVLLVTAATAMVVYLLGATAGGTGCGLLAAVLYLGAFLPQAFSATAVFDPLLTLFVAAAILPVVAINLAGRWLALVLRSVGAGLLGALAFQTRLSGLVALGGVWVVLMIRAVGQRRVGRGATLAVVATAATLVAGTAANLYYWAVPPAGSVPENVRAAQALPLRIVERYEIQMEDLAALLRREQAVQPPLRGLAGRAQFGAEYLVGDLVGLATLLGIAAAVAIAAVRRSLPAPKVVLLGWAAAIFMAIVFWLPVPYPRYLLVVVPPLALAAACGWTALVQAFVEVWQRGDRLGPAIR